MPRSVNKPVRCVVLTTVLEILVTKEFCNPIAKSNKHAIISGWLISIKLLIKAMDNRIMHSIIVGKTKTFNFLFSRKFSIKKLEVKEPNRKAKM